MSNRTYTTQHMCQSIDGPLINWGPREWQNATNWITKKDGSRPTAIELKRMFVEELAQGHRVIPLGEACEGFDYSGGGCPGHPRQPTAEELAEEEKK